MNSVEREQAITNIEWIMNQNDIQPDDIPRCSVLLNKAETLRRNQYDNMSEFIKLMYEEICSQIGPDAAYDKVCDIMDSSWRTSIGINMPRHYKIATVDFSVTVAVPNNASDSDIINVATSYIDKNCCNKVFVEDFNINDTCIDHFDYANSVDMFSDDDF